MIFKIDLNDMEALIAAAVADETSAASLVYEFYLQNNTVIEQIDEKSFSVQSWAHPDVLDGFITRHYERNDGCIFGVDLVNKRYHKDSDGNFYWTATLVI